MAELLGVSTAAPLNVDDDNISTHIDNVNIELQSSGMDRQRTAYHHGNARQALIEAANMLLETTGAAGLSLRQLAEQAGLSRQAPYNHFTDKSALLAELVRDGFERLGSGSEAAAALPALSPTERLAKAAESYIAFGQAQPALFRLMFGKEYVDLSQHRAAQEAAHTALAMLSAIIATMAPQAAVPDMTVVAWSLVHGYTSLCIEAGFEENDRRADRARLFARTVSALVGNNAAGGGVHQGTVRPSRSR